MDDKTLDLLLEQKKEVQKLIQHAIQNEHNPYTHNGSKRLENLRQEMARIDKQIGLSVNN